tara:strand:+ start:50 stop:259 length:210 start_codon:yes stop_codon:yes gene_type:complete
MSLLLLIKCLVKIFLKIFLNSKNKRKLITNKTILKRKLKFTKISKNINKIEVNILLDKLLSIKYYQNFF